MKTTFALDGCYTLLIDGDVPRHAHDPRHVLLQLNHTPMPEIVPGPEPGLEGYVQAPETCVFGALLKPSHARAIASALLSAATEAK